MPNDGTTDTQFAILRENFAAQQEAIHFSSSRAFLGPSRLNVRDALVAAAVAKAAIYENPNREVTTTVGTPAGPVPVPGGSSNG